MSRRDVQKDKPLITFEFKDAQRRADKQAGTPEADHLEGRGAFAKPFSVGIHRETRPNMAKTSPISSRPRPDQPPTANNEAGSTFTPGPMVEEMATRLM